jgi:hypothetical protein
MKKPKKSDTAAFSAALHAVQTRPRGSAKGAPSSSNTLAGAKSLKPDTKGGAQAPKSPPPKPRGRKRK